MSQLSTAAARELALEVWDDLKRTRLTGVAVGMALALVAISVIVFRPGGPPEIRTGYAAADAATPSAPVAKLEPLPVADKPVTIADLDLGSPRDPFRSLAQLADESSRGGSGPGRIVTAAPASSGGGGGAPVSYDEDSSLVPLGDLSPTSSAPPAGGTRRPAAETETDTEPEPKEPPEAPADYSYTADLEFGPPGHLERYAAVERLELVPSRRRPYLMYLGARPDARTAVFMVDSRLSQGGEGRCRPRPSRCTFLELQARGDRDEHHFRDPDGNEYMVRLRRLVRTAVASSSSGRAPRPKLPGSPPLTDGLR